MMSTILLQSGGGFTQLITMVLIIVVFYFFMIRPQMKKQKEHKKYIEEIDINTRVVTTAGIHGRIVEIADKTFLIDVGSGVKMRFDKSAVSLEASKALNTEKPA